MHSTCTTCSVLGSSDSSGFAALPDSAAVDCMPPLSTPDLSTHAKITLFRSLEWLGNMRARLRGAAGPERDTASAARPVIAPGALWVFVSTIGELNAIEPFMTLLLAEMRPEALVLLTDRKTYRDSYLAKYSFARVYELDGTSRDLVDLVRSAPPRLLLLAEIPCMLFDAPCHLSFGASL